MRRQVRVGPRFSAARGFARTPFAQAVRPAAPAARRPAYSAAPPGSTSAARVRSPYAPRVASTHPGTTQARPAATATRAVQRLGRTTTARRQGAANASRA